MSKCRGLCVFSTVLGHKTVVSRLRDALDQLPDFEFTYLLIQPEDYAMYKVPRWARLTDPWEAEFVARRQAQSLRDRPFDVLLLNAWELAVALRDLTRRMPAAAVLDGTPDTMNSQLRGRGVTGPKRWAASKIHHRSFAAAAKHIDYFLPKGSDCADSLHHDYGIARERCFVTLAPQYLDTWKPGARSYSPPARLLFVGNDFLRKGGAFLLQLYSGYLSGTCTLTIASNDPALKSMLLPAGVNWLYGQDRAELLQVFQSSDVFLFPSRQDFTPEVVAEALAVGLPCMVADIPGVRDLVSHGETGFRIPLEAPAAVWAEHLRTLLAKPGELCRMSRNARRFAEEKLGFDGFASLVGNVMGRLQAMRGQRKR